MLVGTGRKMFGVKTIGRVCGRIEQRAWVQVGENRPVDEADLMLLEKVLFELEGNGGAACFTQIPRESTPRTMAHLARSSHASSGLLSSLLKWRPTCWLQFQ